MTTFHAWLIQTKLRSRGPVGDFARDVESDPAAANVANTREAWLLHLGQASCDGVVKAFTQAWKAYIKSQKPVNA